MKRVSFFAMGQWVLFYIYITVFLITFSNKDSWIWSIILMLICAVLIAFEYKRTRRFNSPILLWYFFWLLVITIGRMDLHIYVFGSTWSQHLLKCVVLSTIVFFVSFWIGEYGRPDESIWASEETQLNGDKLLHILCVLLLIAIFAYGLNVVFTGSIPQLSGNVNVARASFVTTFFYRIVNSLRCVFMFVPIALKYSTTRKLKGWAILLSGILLVLEMLSGWRGYTFQAIIMIITSMFLVLNIREKKDVQKNNRRMIIVAALAVTFIIIVSVTRAGIEGSINSKFQYGIRSIYLYIAPNFLNLQTAMNSIEPKGYPLYTTEAVWGLFIPEAYMPGFENINQNIGAYNVSTYMLQPFADMGLFGIISWTFIYSFVGAKAYKKCFRNDSLVWVAILCIVNVSIFTMHNGFFLRASSAVLWLVISLFLQWYMKTDRVIGSKYNP